MEQGVIEGERDVIIVRSESVAGATSFNGVQRGGPTVSQIVITIPG